MINRIEPPCWWIGMKTPLQIMVYGDNLKGSKLHIQQPGVRIKKVHFGDSKNYLFIDIEIDSDANPGKYTFEIKKGNRIKQFSYLIEKRRRGSADRKSFSSADLIYLIVPDRFANGNPTIDSTPDTIEKVNRKEPFGRHGGDLQGIIDHLDYLSDLGVTTLWITPPQLDNEPTESYHGYACADYYQIDPRFGNNELYKKLVSEAHKRNMKVVMDAVPNHCGTAHWWMKDLPFKGWMHIHETIIRSNYRLAALSDPNTSKLVKRQTVEGWFDDNMPDIAIEHPYVLQYFLQLYIWWIECANLDGLRVDTFPYNDKDAIAEWTAHILEEYPNLNIVAECWHSSPAIVSYWYGKTKNPDGYCSNLPSVMDFPLQEALSEGLSIDSTEWKEGMNKIYEAISLDFLYADPKNLLIFLDNHDVDRFADNMGGDMHKIKLGITLLATLRGIPQLYYGTEFGFQADDPSIGHGAARKDFPGGWPKDRKNLFTGNRKNKKETEIYEYTKKLFNWRKSAIPIHHGKTTHFLPEKNTYGFFRYLPQQSVFVFLNPTKYSVDINWKYFSECLQGYSYGINILDGKKVKVGKKYTVPPRSSVILEFNSAID